MLGHRHRRYAGISDAALNPKGRSVDRLEKEDLLRRQKRQYQQPLSQGIYKRRKARIELPFGHLKRNLKVDSFLLRGLEGVRVEPSILADSFNVARLMTLFGVKGLITSSDLADPLRAGRNRPANPPIPPERRE